MVDVSKPKSKPVNASRLGNQDTKDSWSQTAKYRPFFTFGIFSLISFPGSCWQSVPNHCLIRTDTCSNTLLTYSICLTLSFSKVKQQPFCSSHTLSFTCRLITYCVRQWLLHAPLDTLQLLPLLVQLWVAACWLGQIPRPTRSEAMESGMAPSHASELQVALILPLHSYLLLGCPFHEH